MFRIIYRSILSVGALLITLALGQTYRIYLYGDQIYDAATSLPRDLLLLMLTLFWAWWFFVGILVITGIIDLLKRQKSIVFYYIYRIELLFITGYVLLGMLDLVGMYFMSDASDLWKTSLVVLGVLLLIGCFIILIHVVKDCIRYFRRLGR